MKSIKCVNCGAPLEGNKCPYCGSIYSSKGFSATFSKNDYTGVLWVGGKEYKCYIGEVRAETFCLNAGRGMDGAFYRTDPIVKHKFTLIEV